MFLFSAACGSSGGGADGPDGGAMADAAATSDSGPLGPRASALVVPIKNADMAEVAVMTLYDDGNVVDQGLRLPLIPSSVMPPCGAGGDPRRAAIRPDGREAAIIWGGYPGGPGTPKGVTVVDLSGDPAAESTVADCIDFNVSDEGSGDNYQQSPVDLYYVSNDELLIALRGPDVSGVMPATRTATGWELGKLLPIDPGGIEAPLEIKPIPGTSDALVLTFGDASKVYTIRRVADGEWDQVGDFHQLDISVLRIAVHKEGGHAYVASASPIANPGDMSVGRLHVFEPGATGAWEQTAEIQLSGKGSQIMIDPNGEFAVIPDYSPAPDQYRFMTIDLSSPGAPVEVGTTTSIQGFLMRDFEIGPDGQMVVSVDVNGAKQLRSMVQTAPGQWATVWGPTDMPGGIDDVAVATVSHVID